MLELSLWLASVIGEMIEKTAINNSIKISNKAFFSSIYYDTKRGAKKQEL